MLCNEADSRRSGGLDADSNNDEEAARPDAAAGVVRDGAGLWWAGAAASAPAGAAASRGQLHLRVAKSSHFVVDVELKVKDESIKDTLVDMANYALIALILYEEENDN